jgi:hypothetical protein
MIRNVIILLIIACNAFSQKVMETSGEAQVRIESDMSKEEAMEMARQQAMINAIDNAFGSYVEQDSDMFIESGKSDFKIIGHTLVKGDWLKTIKEKFKEESKVVKGSRGKETEIWISCKLNGMVREITKPQINLSFEPRNCLTELCRTYSFISGAPMYLSFTSPVDGYLSIYIVEDNQIAYRLLPYQEMPEKYLHAIPVKADMEYMFFASDESYNYFENFSYLMIDEIYLETSKEKEFLDLYVIFSSEKYRKPLLKTSEKITDSYILPKKLEKIEFMEWLQDSRVYDSEFQYNRITLTVSK